MAGLTFPMGFLRDGWGAVRHRPYTASAGTFVQSNPTLVRKHSLLQQHVVQPPTGTKPVEEPIHKVLLPRYSCSKRIQQIHTNSIA